MVHGLAWLRGTAHAGLLWAPMTACDGDFWVMIKYVGRPMESGDLPHMAWQWELRLVVCNILDICALYFPLYSIINPEYQNWP